jgi:hypothetical protein
LITAGEIALARVSRVKEFSGPLGGNHAERELLRVENCVADAVSNVGKSGIVERPNGCAILTQSEIDIIADGRTWRDRWSSRGVAGTICAGIKDQRIKRIAGRGRVRWSARIPFALGASRGARITGTKISLDGYGIGIEVVVPCDGSGVYPINYVRWSIAGTYLLEKIILFYKGQQKRERRTDPLLTQA